MNRKQSVTTQELINHAIGLTFTLLGLYLMKKMSKPEFGLTLKMKSALIVKNVAQSQADAWQAIAGSAATTYNKCRL